MTNDQTKLLEEFYEDLRRNRLEPLINQDGELEYTAALLAAKEQQTLERVKQELKKLWIKGIDHPYITDDYNQALVAAKKAINLLNKQNDES